MKTTVKRGKTVYVCTSEEQLELFKKAGYVEDKQPEAEAPKAAAPKRSKSK